MPRSLSRETEPEDRSLSDAITVSEYLLWYSDAITVTGNADFHSLRGGLNLYTKPNNLPNASVQVDAGLSENPSATLSVGSKLLNFESRLERGQDGDALTNTASGEVGPVSAFYSNTSQPDNRGFEQTKYGGGLNLGPVQLYGQRNQLSQDAGPVQKTDAFGARGPLGRGILSADISRQRGAGQFPNVTRYSAGYEGRVGPGNLALQGNLTDVRGVGMEPSVGGSYTVPNPLGLGGQFRATGSYVNPLDPNQKTAAEAMMRYNLKF
jgi:hypothetical protein